MSWQREIKIMYTISFLILSFIIWSVLTRVFFGMEINEKLFLLSIVSVFIMIFLLNKNITKKYQNEICIVISTIISAPIIWFMYQNYMAALSIIYIIALLIICVNFEYESINYEGYRDIARGSLILCIIFGTISLFIDEKLTEALLKYNVFLIVITILLLRESRRFAYKIRNKKARIYNLIITMFIGLLSSNSIFSLAKKLFTVVLRPINFLLEKIIDGITFILSAPITAIIEFMSGLFSDDSNEILKKISKEGKTAKEMKKIDWQAAENYEYSFIFKIIKVVLFILILLLIIKFIGKIRDSASGNKTITEEREKIIREKNKKENIFKRIIKNIFTGDMNIKEQILYTYKKFQIKTDEKEIFKEYMTASQLNNVTKIHVDKPKELDSMVEIYNEAKFSQHEMNNEKLQSIKINYKNIKDEL